MMFSLIFVFLLNVSLFGGVLSFYRTPPAALTFTARDGNLVTMMAEKKGAKKSASSAEQAPKQLQPQRVTNQINIPVRQQIAWAKAYKRLMTEKTGGSSQQSVTKKFRKVRGPKEVEEEAVEIDYVNTKPPAVFVDGYNIIGYINKAEGRSNSVDLEDARDCLVNDLCVVSGATGWWIEVVFDAYMSASSIGGSKTSLIDNILVTYTSASETADNYIERRFSELANEGFTNMVVATDDNLLRMVAGSAGAGYLSAGQLLDEFRIAYKGWENVQEEMEIEAKKKGRNAMGVSDDMKIIIEQMKAEALVRASEEDALRKKKSADIMAEKQLRKKAQRTTTEEKKGSGSGREIQMPRPGNVQITTSKHIENKNDDDAEILKKFEELLKTGNLRLR